MRSDVVAAKLSTLVAAALLTSPVSAGGPPDPGGSGIELSAREITAGDTFTVSGTGCEPDSNVNIALDGFGAATTHTDARGSFRVPVTPSAQIEPGDHTVTATGRGCGSTVTFTVLAARSGEDDSSWRIVAAISIMLAALVLAGTLAVGILRRDTARADLRRTQPRDIDPQS